MKGIAGAAIAVAIVLGSTLIVYSMLAPTVEEGRSAQDFIEAKNTLAQIDQSINQLAVEAPGARREIDLDVSDARLIVSGDEEKIKLRLEGFTLLDPGSIVQEGNIYIRGGGFVDAVEEDIDNDGNTDLVLRNRALTFAIRKIGSSTNMTAMDTEDMITLIYNNRTGTTVRPRSAVMINDNPSTSSGTGYTSLTTQGSNIETGAILVFVNTSTGISYEALFTLAAGTDYVDLQVKNIKGV